MSEKDKKFWIDSAIKILTNFYKDYDYTRFRPFFHGTSNIHYKRIKHEGLCPRGKKRPSVWRPKITSPEDRVFFAMCGDTLPLNAASEAVSKVNELRQNLTEEEFKNIFGLKPSEITEKPEEIFLQLKNFKKYKEHIVRDTDENFAVDIRDSHYNDENTSIIKIASSLCNQNIEKEVIDILDVIWAECGYDCVKEVVTNAIPETLKSLYTLPFSIAFKEICIAPEDLEVVEKAEIHTQCIDKSEDGGCDLEEFELKRQLTHGLELMKFDTEIFFSIYEIKNEIRELEDRKHLVSSMFKDNPELVEQTIANYEKKQQNLQEKIKSLNEKFKDGEKMVKETRHALKQLIKTKKVPRFLKKVAEK